MSRRLRRVAPRGPMIVAEMGASHNQDLDRALALVERAHRAGCHAIKLQTYTANTMVIRDKHGSAPIIEGGSWAGQNLWELYDRAALPWSWHKSIFDRARELGILAFSTPFDETAVDLLERLECPLYKIASFEILDLRLIRKCAATGKPLVISTGMATQPEIEDAVIAARDAGCEELTLLKCTSTYPAPMAEANLATIPAMRAQYACEVGLSDHTLGHTAAVLATALGASMIEKHFTIDRGDAGPDAGFSAEPHEMIALVKACDEAAQAIGVVSYGPTPSETPSLRLRRTLHVIRDIQPGDTLTSTNVGPMRPGDGLAPRYIPHILGQKAVLHARRGEPLTWEIVGRASPLKV